MLGGVIHWGLPMAIMFSGMVVLEAGDSLRVVVFGIGLAWAICLVGGVAFGAFIHALMRFGDRERASR